MTRSTLFYLAPQQWDNERCRESDCDDYESQHLEHGEIPLRCAGKPGTLGSRLQPPDMARCDDHHKKIDCKVAARNYSQCGQMSTYGTVLLN
jgi:hypothetical protein